MKANEIREKYLKFFEKRGHKIIAPAPLVLNQDPTTLFTSSGMQPLVPYLMGKEYPGGVKRLVDSQPSFRAQDIEEVGDNRHTTFFEMLGNWSLGDYFKKDQLPWIWEFLTEELNLPKEKLYVTVFESDKSVPEDKESYEIWKDLGVPENHIYKYGVNKNWWSRAGTPEQMPDGEIGGPDSEIFFEFESVTHDKKFGEKCHPNCDCGRFLEIGNSVFIEYRKENGKLVELPQKNVDFGGGLERIAAAVNNDPDVFKTDLFWPIIEEAEKVSGKNYQGNETSMRIITDHIKASTFLIVSGVTPSNKLQGYVLRRLLRHATVKMKNLSVFVNKVFEIYKDTDYLKDVSQEKIIKVIEDESLKFSKALQEGVKFVGKVDPFNLFQTYGFPKDVIEEIYKDKGMKFDKEKFDRQFNEHQELSRKSSKDKFKAK